MKSALNALKLAVSAEHSVVQVSDGAWNWGNHWKQNYNKVDYSNLKELLRLGQGNRMKRAKNKA